jgi:hypothetical protein
VYRCGKPSRGSDIPERKKPNVPPATPEVETGFLWPAWAKLAGSYIRNKAGAQVVGRLGVPEFKPQNGGRGKGGCGYAPSTVPPTQELRQRWEDWGLRVTQAKTQHLIWKTN